MLNGYAQHLNVGIGWFVQFSLFFITLYVLLRLLFKPRNRWRVHLKDWRLRSAPRWWLKLWRVHEDSIHLQERRVLLAGCGLPIVSELYVAYRRCGMFILFVVGLVIYYLTKHHVIAPFTAWNIELVLITLFMMGWCDRALLHTFRRYRTDRIRKELVIVSKQLLYYVGSRLSLHGKLMKCVTLTHYIRNELNLLLNEWYHDADQALLRFRDRLGTDEAYAFAEQLRSLQWSESEAIYDLLREVVHEFKARTEIAKDSRKETTSYLLFVLAGIPILYMFQIFLYPWVQEASKLFDALNP
ncbi:MAG: hypothetical protein P0Y55_03700 [Candidatus Cohnella colombiensis]|uniref:Uncharacterized protein n=1 Tax=Candidatus Cohnella colombiensis TaxID=3121368 RepID=A0AA95EYE3_9BACL|nr:MAG: hypothetical protein P0Y55_03700 [Cohnella sp.]